MPISDAQTKEMTSAGLNLIAQALSIYDSDLRLVVSNQRFEDMFDLPQKKRWPKPPFKVTKQNLWEI